MLERANDGDITYHQHQLYQWSCILKIIVFIILSGIL